MGKRFGASGLHTLEQAVIADTAALAAGVWAVIADLIPADQQITAARELLALFEQYNGGPLWGCPHLYSAAGIFLDTMNRSHTPNKKPAGTDESCRRTLAERKPESDSM